MNTQNGTKDLDKSIHDEKPHHNVKLVALYKLDMKAAALEVLE